MINRSNASIQSLAIHSIGNQTIGTDIQFSSGPIALASDLHADSFMKISLDAFKEPIFYTFNVAAFSEIGREVYDLSKKVFEGEASLYEASVHFARYLYQKSTNSQIKQSFFVAALIKDMLIDDELLDGIILCKYEIQDSFIQFNNENGIWQMQEQFGYYPGKVDKLCLILNTNVESGYKVLSLDKTNLKSDAKYWREDFLNISLSGNDYTFTSDYIKLTGNFLKNRKPLEEILQKGEEVSVLSRSQDYFKNNSKFDEEDYKSEVFQDNKLINAFDQYKEAWQEKTNRPLAQAFDLDEMALNKQSKVFRSVIKLDRNFHIYVHGDSNKIMRGVDDEGRKYYILYFNEES